jgi:hypothetical protein
MQSSDGGTLPIFPAGQALATLQTRETLVPVQLVACQPSAILVEELPPELTIESLFTGSHIVPLGFSCMYPAGHEEHDTNPFSLPNLPGKQGKHEAWPSAS